MQCKICATMAREIICPNPDKDVTQYVGETRVAVYLSMSMLGHSSADLISRAAMRLQFLSCLVVLDLFIAFNLEFLKHDLLLIVEASLFSGMVSVVLSWPVVQGVNQYPNIISKCSRKA